MAIDSNAAAFVLGRAGRTKKKIARVCGCDLDLDDRTGEMKIYGSKKKREKAKTYIQYVSQQRLGPVCVDLPKPRDDLTVVDVPKKCIGFVMGKGGTTLRSFEDEFGTLVFFATVREPNGGERRDQLCVFGSLKARRGTELKVMSIVERKEPNYFTKDGKLRSFRRIMGDTDDDGWTIDTRRLSEEDFSYALGSKGSTRHKLAIASGCIIEYVGRVACMAGYKEERGRAKKYLEWVIEQRSRRMSVTAENHYDCLVVKVPAMSVGFITGNQGEGLRRIEKDSGGFVFFNADPNRHSGHHKNLDLLVFAGKGRCRETAKRLILDKIERHKRLQARNSRRRRSNNERRFSGRKRSRSPFRSRRGRSRSSSTDGYRRRSKYGSSRKRS